MASLLDLTVQGDVATITDESKLPQIKRMGRLRVIGVGLPAVTG
jgi:hypothetical protein